MDASTCIKVSDLPIDALCDLHPRLRKFVLHFSFNLMAHHCIANDFAVNLRLAACRGCKVERQTIMNFPTAPTQTHSCLNTIRHQIIMLWSTSLTSDDDSISLNNGTSRRWR
jgi:hypothetical protein